MYFGIIRTQTSLHCMPCGYTNTTEKQETNQKSYLMKIVEFFKEDINNSLKEIQDDTIKQVKELNKAAQDLKV